LVESGEGVWGGGFLGRIKRRGWKDTKDIVRKRRIVVGSQNHREREREREMHISQCKSFCFSATCKLGGTNSFLLALGLTYYTTCWGGEIK